MSSMKPLMSPRPRRRDRAAGARTERLNESLLRSSRSALSTRDPESKRRAFQQLLDRRQPRRVSWDLAIVVSVVVALWILLG